MLADALARLRERAAATALPESRGETGENGEALE